MKRKLCLAELERSADHGEFIQEMTEGFMFKGREIYLVIPKVGLTSADGEKVMGADSHDFCFAVPASSTELEEDPDNPDDDPDNIAYRYRLKGSEYILPPAIARNGSHELMFGKWREVSVNGVDRWAFFIAEEPKEGEHVLAFCYRPLEVESPSVQPGLLFSDFAVSEDEHYIAIYVVDDSWRLAQQCCQRQFEYDAAALD